MCFRLLIQSTKLKVMTRSHLAPRKSLRSHKLIALVAASGLVLAACDGTDTSNEAASSTVTMTTTPTSETTTTTQAEDEAATKSPTSREASIPASSTAEFSGNNDLHITEVRAGSHDGFDRVTIEFSGTATPGWFAAYTDEPVQLASGYPLEVVGDSYLEVMVRGVTMEIPDSGWVYPAGPVEEVQPQGEIAGVTHGGVFEAAGQFIIGLNGEARPYTIEALNEPPRLVIDIQQP